MGVKMIISERQFEKIKQRLGLNENLAHESLVEKIVTDLNANYEPMIGIVREDEEYYEKPMIKIKVDESSITPKQLFEYFKKKYNLGDEFTQQVIRDWAFGTLNGNKLSKNVPIN